MPKGNEYNQEKRTSEKEKKWKTKKHTHTRQKIETTCREKKTVYKTSKIA